MAIWNPGMNLRQEVDGTPQGIAIGDLFPVDWSSKTRLAGQLRGETGPCPDHIRVRRDLPGHTCTEKAPWRPKWSYVKGCSLHIRLFSKIYLGSEMRVHRWEDPEIYQIWTVNQANQSDWSKETQKKCLMKVIQTAMMVPLSDPTCPETAHGSVHSSCTLCPLNEYSTCLTTFNLCGDSFLQSRRAGVLVADHWTSG